MNEIKRQLNQHIGDTNARVHSIMKNVEQQKKLQQAIPKRNWNNVFYIGIASIITALALFFTLSNLSPSPLNPNTAAPLENSQEIQEKENQTREKLEDERDQLVEIVNSNFVSIYNENLAKDEQILITDLPFLYLNSDLESVVSYRLTYRKLIDTNKGAIGVISYNCNEQEQCNYVFVYRNGESTKQLATAYGSYGNTQLSPDLSSFAAIPIHTLQTEGVTTVEVSQILVFDLTTFEQIIPSENAQFFDTATAPITSFSLTNSEISLQVANIESYTHNQIFEWQNNPERPTVTYTISFE